MGQGLGGGLAQGLGIRLFAFGGAYWLLILTLCGLERVLVVSTEPLGGEGGRKAKHVLSSAAWAFGTLVLGSLRFALRSDAACGGTSSVACGRPYAAQPFPATQSYINPSPPHRQPLPVVSTAGIAPPQTAAVH